MSKLVKQRALLTLEDGRVFEGYSLGVEGEKDGEVVFNTSLTGYQEVLTDPSYKGQIVTMTYPLIGNYGITEEDFESARPWVEGFVVREGCPYPSNWRSRGSLLDFLKKYHIVAIEGVDTRALTRHIRDKGAMRAVLSTVDLDPQSLVKKAKASPGLLGRDLVKEVTCQEAYHLSSWERPRFRVVAYDFGIKRNILNELMKQGCHVRVVPGYTEAEEVLNLKPDGVLLSNGPGDPEGLESIIQNIRRLIGQVPLFGICLGHQLLGLALGGKTYKLKFGHHGGNQPIKNLKTGKIEIATENHGFAVDWSSLQAEELEQTHINLNDGTIEGMRHKSLPLFSVQFHPEASPGPHDSSYLFEEFIWLMEGK